VSVGSLRRVPAESKGAPPAGPSFSISSPLRGALRCGSNSNMYSAKYRLDLGKSPRWAFLSDPLGSLSYIGIDDAKGNSDD
jgi:hypothetical protein